MATRLRRQEYEESGGGHIYQYREGRSIVEGPTALQMEAEKSCVTKICDLALEIICMLTGEKYAAVKMASIEGLLGGMYPPLSVGGSLSLTPMTKPPSHSWISESNNKKILEVANKIIELLAGEVSSVCDSGAVCSFIEERRLDTAMEDQARVTSLGIRLSFPAEEERNVDKDHLDTVMEDRSQITAKDGSSEGTPSGIPPHSSRSRDSTEDIQEISHQHQVIYDEQNIKVVKEESEEVDVRGEVCCMEKEPSSDTQRQCMESVFLCPADGSSEGTPFGIPPHSSHSRDSTEGNQEISHQHQVIEFEQILKVVKEELEEADVRGEESFMEEEPSQELPMRSSLEDYGSSHHDQGQYLRDVKQEEEKDVWSRQYKEEGSSLQSRDDWMNNQDTQEQPIDNFFSDGIKSESNTLTIDSLENVVAIPIHHSDPTQEKPYSCLICGKCFKYSSELSIHQRSHTGEKPYSCSECGKCYSLIGNLNAHRKTHTGEKPYSCSDCGKSYSHIGNLNAHRRTHTGEKPYSCSECGRCFSQQSSLINHERLHTGQKPYSCPECGKCYAQITALNSHKRTHTGEKPYSCPDCGKCYSQSGNLRVHRRTHTRDRNHIHVPSVENVFPR